MAVISSPGGTGLSRAFLDEKCYQRRAGDADYNFVISNMVTYKIVPIQVVADSNNWITPTVLSCDAFVFVYNARFPQTHKRIRQIMDLFIVQKGTDRFPSVVCEIFEGSKHRIVPKLSGKHLAENFGFKFFQVDIEGEVRPVFERIVEVYRAIINIETRIRRRRQQARKRVVSRGASGESNADIRLLIATVIVIFLLIALMVYTLVYFAKSGNGTFKLRRRRKRR